MNSKFDEILSQSFEIFKTHGIKPVSMADLASQMHVSKKTIYKYVSNKQDLIQTLFIDYIPDDFIKQQELIKHESTNAIDYFWNIKDYIFSLCGFMSEKMKFDLLTNYPQTFNEFQTKLQSLLNSFYTQNMIQGVQEGIYKKAILLPHKAELFSQFNMQIKHNLQISQEAIITEFFNTYVVSIATESGLEIHSHYTSKEC